MLYKYVYSRITSENKGIFLLLLPVSKTVFASGPHVSKSALLMIKPSFASSDIEPNTPASPLCHCRPCLNESSYTTNISYSSVPQNVADETFKNT